MVQSLARVRPLPMSAAAIAASPVYRAVAKALPIFERGSHQRRCKSPLGECKVCSDGVALLATIPPRTLSNMLADALAPKWRISFSSVVVENMMERTEEQVRHGKQSPKAAADVEEAMGWLGSYRNRGGRL